MKGDRKNLRIFLFIESFCPVDKGVPCIKNVTEASQEI